MKLNKRNLSVGVLTVGLTTILIAFQNFVPHDSFRGQNGSGLYLNGALTEALKEAEQEKRNKEREALKANLSGAKEQKISNAKEQPDDGDAAKANNP